MQQSSAAIVTNPTTYRTNVLNAVRNCVNEYRQIVRYHRNDQLQQSQAQMQQMVAVPIFELIQQSLQCGPLAGSKPGYFKRCGSEMAKIVHEYLDDMLCPESLELFTEKQRSAVTKWKQDAHKAYANGDSKPPSKSVLKKQLKSRGKTKK
mmetsp:Transcript_24778/g.69577  ORF Transcript_24778/g.69577 Transcript_24778/m.69577 type:complete len:150 (-) Transcript_24778:1499-1948(-)